MARSSCLPTSAWRRTAGRAVRKPCTQNWPRQSANPPHRGKYIEELEDKEVCTIRSGTNQYARTCFEIRDEYWPYRRTQEVEGADGPVRNAYVDAIKSSFVATGCTIGKFSARDAQLAQDLQQRGILLEIVQDAILMGAARKYISWLNGGAPQPIGSLVYFATLVSEIQERPLPADYREYLRKKVAQLAKTWAKESAKGPKNGDAQICPARKSSNSGLYTRRFLWDAGS